MRHKISIALDKVNNDFVWQRVLFVDSKLARRMKNALEFICFADAHTNEAVVLSFCVSAIEAMLCNGERGKVEMPRKRIPALLQCDQDQAEQIERVINNLYNRRSRCLHGEHLSADSQHVAAARKLTAALLRGAIEWSIGQQRSEVEPTDALWIAELRRATADKDQIGAVSGVTKELAEHAESFRNIFGSDRLGDVLDGIDDD